MTGARRVRGGGWWVRKSRWMEGCYKFLADRSKPKMLVYNVMQVALAF